jgi:hypothetical protein
MRFLNLLNACRIDEKFHALFFCCRKGKVIRAINEHYPGGKIPWG